jgi:hypothetical protein
VLKKSAENKNNFAKILPQIDSRPVNCGKNSVGVPHLPKGSVEQLATVRPLRQVCFQPTAESPPLAVFATILPQLLGNEVAKACVCGGSMQSEQGQL